MSDSTDNSVTDRLAGAVAAKICSGDQCPVEECGGKLLVYSTRIVGNSRVRYLRCNLCGATPEHNKQMVPLEYGPSRSQS